MSGILRLESLTKGNTLKQGDKTPLKYRLFDADGEKLNIAGKSATVRLVYPDFLTIGYEKGGLTVGQDDTVTFTIDGVIPSRIYHVEIIVDDKFIFPSHADESKFTVDKSSLGTESNIVEIVGVDAVVRKAVDLINDDPSLIIDEDKLVGDIISNTGIGNINEYYKAFNDLKPKAEQSITKSAEALTKSQNALNVANGIDAKATNALSLSESADTLSKSVQEQFNQVIIDGDSSVEAAQARVDASGQTNPTLKARLDKEHNEVTTQLTQTDSRIDNIIATAGDGTIPTELSDMRLRSDGTLATTAGQALRDTQSGEAIEDRALSVDKLNFIKYGSNAYNPDESEIDMYLSSSDGTTYPSDNFRTSGYIDISDVSNFFIKTARRVVYYDRFKAKVGNYPDSIIKQNKIYDDFPENTHYMRFDFALIDLTNYGFTQKVNLGSAELPYEPYRHPIIDKEFVEKQDIDLSDIPDDSITKEKVDFISLGKNLFDVTTGQAGFISWTNGIYSPSTSLRYFAPMPVVAGEKYVFNAQARMIAFFNGTSFISGINNPPANTPITAPANSNNAVITLSSTSIQGFQFEKGETPTSYEPYGYRLNGITLLNEEDKTEVFVNLPEKIFALVGQELNIYYDNILSDKDSDYTFDVTCSIGKQYTNYYRVTPTTSGNYSFTIKVLKDGNVISQKNTTIVVSGTSKGAGLTKSLLVIGDSTTAGSTVVNKLAENFESDSMNITLVGTKGSGVNKHEGISGWTARQYTTLAQDQTLPDVKNPFFNSETNKFDFSYYSTTTGVNPDYVVLNLGINDLFSYTEDGGAESRIVEFIGQYHEMIDSIKSHNSSIKIGVALTIPPAYSQDAFAESYLNGQTRDRVKRNNVLLVRRLIEEFDNTDVYIVPINTNLDTRHNFPMDYVTPKVPVNARNTEVLVDKYAANAGVHPAESGYWQIADVYWYWIKAIV